MAAQNGTITLLRPNGLRKVLSIYASDSAGASITISSDGKADANAPAFFLAPGACGVEDFCLAAATGQTTTTIKVNDVPQSVVLNANYLAAVTTRPPIGIVLRKGDKLTMVQVA